MKRTDSQTPVAQSIDWYAQGDSQMVEVNGVRIIVRLVGRKGRRARIAISAPSTAKFSAASNESDTFPIVTR